MTNASDIATLPRGAMEYRMQGEGPCVLLVHGGHSSCEETFGLHALLAGGFSVLTPSRPGYGRTPATTGPSAETTADATAELLDELGIERVHVVGVSAGGPSALHFVARHPERVEKLVLASAVTRLWYAPGDEMHATMQRVFGRWEQWTWRMMRTIATLAPRRHARMILEPLTTQDIDQVMAQLSADDVRELQRMTRRQSSGRGFLLDLEHRVEPRVLDGVRAPTLVVHSRSDGSVGFAHAEHAVEHTAEAELVEAPTLSHLLWIGSGQAQVDTAVVGFLRGP